MKIQAVQDRTFQAKQRFLSLEAKKNMQALLRKMNNETVMDCTETTFSSKMLTGIKINKDSAFYDRRFFCAPSKDLTGFSELVTGKTELLLDNMSGAVKALHKPFFKRWSGIMKNAEEILKTAVENFDNNEVVEKRFLGVKGFTQKGSEIIQNAWNEVRKGVK